MRRSKPEDACCQNGRFCARTRWGHECLRYDGIVKTLRVHVAELATSNEPTTADGVAAEVVSNRATAAGHLVVGCTPIADDEAALQAQLAAWIADDGIDVVIAIAPDTTRVFAVLARLGTLRGLAGAAHLEGARLTQCGNTVVFVVPESTGAVIEAMDSVEAELALLMAADATAEAGVASVTSADVAATGRRRTQPPPLPAEKRASTPPPLPVREDVVSTSEIVAIADVPPPPPVREDTVSTSEIVAIADAPQVRRTVPPPLPPSGPDDQVVAGAVLLAPRRNRVWIGRWIAVALLAGATGFGFTAWLLRGTHSSSSVPTVSETAEPSSTASAIDPSWDGDGGIEANAEIPEVVVDVSGSEKPGAPSDDSATAAVARRPIGESAAGESATESSAPAPGCSEEACILEHNAKPCCEVYKRGSVDDKPTALARWMVKAGVEQVKPLVVACGEKVAAHGTVNVVVTVDPEGSVAHAVVADSPSPALGECVGAAMRSAQFAKTATGGTFRYPFVF